MIDRTLPIGTIFSGKPSPARMTAERLDYLRAAADEIEHAATVAECVAEIDALRAELKVANDELSCAETELEQLENIEEQKIAIEQQAIRESLVEYILAVRGIGCEHKHPPPDDVCARCRADAFLASLGGAT